MSLVIFIQYLRRLNTVSLCLVTVELLVRVADLPLITKHVTEHTINLKYLGIIRDKMLIFIPHYNMRIAKRDYLFSGLIRI